MFVRSKLCVLRPKVFIHPWLLTAPRRFSALPQPQMPEKQEKATEPLAKQANLLRWRTAIENKMEKRFLLRVSVKLVVTVGFLGYSGFGFLATANFLMAGDPRLFGLFVVVTVVIADVLDRF